MPRLNEEQWQSLADRLRSEIPRLAPDWTEHNTHDPGITVLELLSFVLSELQYRIELPDPRRRSLALQIAQLAQSLAGAANADDCPPGLQRVNYSTGGLLGVDEFTAEQDYFRLKARRHNRLLHGAGVVAGLQVTVERTADAAQVVIAPGLALNSRGEEIEVGAPTALALPAQTDTLFVLLHYAEQPCHPVAAVSEPLDAAQEQIRYSRTVETFRVSLAPEPDDEVVVLAQLNSSRGRWTLDRRFRAARIKR